MATRIQVKRLANPHRAKRRNARKRRKMSPKQIRHFGTKAQKAALKRKNRRTNPTKRSVRKRVRKALSTYVKRRRNKRRSNPATRRNAVILTLGAMNPRRTKRRNKPVATRRKNRRRRRVNTAPARRTNRRRRRNPVARRTNRRRRRNATRVVVVAPRANRRRRRNTRRRVHHRRRRNPMSTTLFGAPLFGRASLELVGGGLVGVAAAKFIPTLLPGALTGGIASSSIGKVIISGISAVVGGWAGSKVSPQFGQGMLFGGMMQTFSIALNSFLPTVYGQLAPYSSLGELMPGQFSVPQNPLRLPPPPPVALPPAGAQARVTMNGLARAYGAAF